MMEADEKEFLPGQNVPKWSLSLRLEDALLQLSAALRNVVFYGLSHSVTRSCVHRVSNELERLLAEQTPITIHVLDDQILYGNFPLCHMAGTLVPLAEDLRLRGVDRLTFTSGLDGRETEAFLEIMAADPTSLKLAGGVSRVMAQKSVVHIQVAEEELDERPHSQRSSVEIYEDAVETVKRTMTAVAQHGQIDAGRVREAVEEMLSVVLHDSAALLSLAAIKGWDQYLYQHSVNVCVISMVFGCTLRFNETEMVDLGMAAILHDVGKIFVPEQILGKPGPLTDAEWAVLHSHPVMGAKILASTPGIPDAAAVVAFEHHIRQDYTGYPRLETLRQLHPYSHIVNIVDTYDALTTVRPYRPAIRPEHAVGWMLYAARTHFEPNLLTRFSAMMRMYPVGAIVRLNNGTWGVISGPSKQDPARPLVRMILDQKGVVIQAKKKLSLAEREPDGSYRFAITDCPQPVSRILPITDAFVR
jgi:HD-GYP domain-containing protein (c-di-GMP phosphodiesterase class II)